MEPAPMKCVVCRKRRPKTGMECGPCKAEKRRLAAIRYAEVRAEPTQYELAKAPLVEKYAAIIEAGGRLFEPTPK